MEETCLTPPGTSSGKPIMLDHAVGSITTVSDLLDVNGRWNEDKVRWFFTPTDASFILQIPLSSRRVSDRLCWKLERDGRFSVKSSYRYAFCTSSSLSPIQHGVNTIFWKKLWKASIPNKAKVHMWRVCLDILPSRGSLVSRHVELESTVCVLCESYGESTLHLCRDCQFTRSVICANPILKKTCYRWGSIHASVIEWLNHCAQELTTDYFGELLFILWSVWTERNDRVWNQKNMMASDVGIQLYSRLCEFRFHSNGRTRANKPKQVAKWQPPFAGICKINVDGAFFQNTRNGGMSFVIRDSTGSMLAGGAFPASTLISAEHAEVLACAKAIEFAETHGFTPAILETDALEVKMQLMDDGVSNTSVLGRIYDDLRVRLRQHGTWMVSHVGRKGNKVVHSLASYACSLVQDEFDFSSPLFLQAAIAAELCTI